MLELRFGSVPMGSYATVARELAGKPEEELANPANPASLDLVIACAGLHYDAGSLFLYALQARRRAAQIGAVTGIVRWSGVVTATRGLVHADAEKLPPEPVKEVSGDGGALR